MVPLEPRIPPGRLKKSILTEPQKTAQKGNSACIRSHLLRDKFALLGLYAACCGHHIASDINSALQEASRGVSWPSWGLFLALLGLLMALLRLFLALLRLILAVLGPPSGDLVPYLGRLGLQDACPHVSIYIYTYIERNWYLPQVAFLILDRPAT